MHFSYFVFSSAREKYAFLIFTQILCQERLLLYIFFSELNTIIRIYNLNLNVCLYLWVVILCSSNNQSTAASVQTEQELCSLLMMDASALTTSFDLFSVQTFVHLTTASSTSATSAPPRASDLVVSSQICHPASLQGYADKSQEASKNSDVSLVV